MTQNIDRQALAKKAHAAAVAKGFWDENYSPEHYLMLVITELSEAVEAHRKGKHADIKNYADSAQTTFNFEHYIKDTLEDELADAYIRLLDLAQGFGYDLEVDDISDLCYDEGVYAYKQMSFTEAVFNLSRGITYHSIRSGELKKKLPFVLSDIEAIAEVHNIPISWHIEEKMKYNETRPARHGKEY